jgi:adenosylcobyric acid synthase
LTLQNFYYICSMKQAFLIAAPTSGSGKTTIARGLMALLTEKGMKVQPFKCGPDYIDTKFHEAVCGRPSVNLDTFMATPEHVRELFARYGEDADVCIVEGMMGMFDGYDRDRGSSAEIASVLGIPVVLVVDAKSAAYSMAPLLQGFINFRKDVRIAGVIFNKVGSERHFRMLQEVCDDVGVECLGYLPKQASLEQGSRYLGLDFSLPPNPSPKGEGSKYFSAIADNILTKLSPISLTTPLALGRGAGGGAGIGGHALIARNAEAFSFVYQETIDSFASVRFFDPEKDVPCFDGIDLLYLPGGYPEKHLEALVANEACRKAIKAYAEQGGRIQAECGGMMYLCEKIVTDDGEYEMCGVLPYTITARKADRKLSLGYRRFELDGKEYRGHEFHYTQFLGEVPESITQVHNAKGEPVPTPVFRYKNVLASYTHLYRPAQNHTTPLTHREGPGEGLHPLMFVGTGSDVGKSIIATALCRIFKQDGYSPAPFKAQNMALNSYATPEGLEIGRAQAVQAEAAGIPCHTDMNPLLLKPNSDHTSQVVLNGKPIGNRDAYDFWRRGEVLRGSASQSAIDFRKEVCDAFDRLAARYNPIVMEGAGSISEINLRATDLVNLPMAQHAKADVILVGDIDRGGVFASVYGSIMLQTPEDRKLIKGIIINKFRGDMRLFDEGRRMMEEICGIPVLGVVPYYKDIHIEEEDSVSLEKKQRELAEGKVNVAVVLLRHISNFTDFDILERDPRVNLFYTNNVSDIERADIIILPGTKSTLDDLLELRRNSCAQAIQRAHRDGKMVVGICGGYQMLGQTVDDPEGIEGSITSLPGLGLLPIHTTMTPEKTTQQVTFTFEGQACQGYEIHQGVSDTDQAILQTDHCIGTYIHGFLDNAPVIDFLLDHMDHGDGSDDPHCCATYQENRPHDLRAFKDEQYDKLAKHVRQHVDIDRIYRILSGED